MSDPSDSTDDAWDDAAPADEKPSSGDEHRVDTVPPPASGDAYSADTVIRDVPREALDAIREKQRAERRSRKGDDLPKISGGMDENTSAKTRAAEPPREITEAAGGEKSSTASAPASAPKTPERAAEKSKAPVEKVSRPPQAYRYLGPEPVTPSELLTALASAVIVIVAAFYLIASAF